MPFMSFFCSFSAGCVALPALINIKAVIEQRQCTGVWNQKDELPVSGCSAALGQISDGKCCFQVSSGMFYMAATSSSSGAWGSLRPWGTQTLTQPATQAAPDTALPSAAPTGLA